jgi:hypothetical protein
MVDNFQKISELINPTTDGDDFYFVQIIKRRKDNPGMKGDARVIKILLPTGAEELMGMKEEIMEWCRLHNARAYIHLNARSKEKVAMETLKQIATHMCNGHYDLKDTYASCCGVHNSEKERKWVVDIDNLEELTTEYVDNILSFVKELQIKAGREPFIDVVPTKNGVHLIANPFNRAVFAETYPDVVVAKDTPTVLFLN